MALKAKKVTIKETNSKGVVERLEEIKISLKDIEIKIGKLNSERVALEEEALSIEIAPFKVGGYALVEISSGRSKKWQKCLLECERGFLYVRPVKENGELSGRHFSLLPTFGKTYSDYLKEVN